VTTTSEVVFDGADWNDVLRGQENVRTNEVPTTDDELFDEVETWLRANLPADWVAAIDHDDAPALSAARAALDVADWWKRLGSTGYFFSHWPVEYGGLGLDTDRRTVVNNALRKYKVPRSDNPLGLNVSEALLMWGTDEQKRRFLPGILDQTEIWVQLFSEPGAGSDLASLSTRAERDGDQWIVRGQKVWSSHAERSHWGLLLARTDPELPKHQGISMFLIDMNQPQITVRPLKQITGEQFFNEVFFDDAVVDDANRLGAIGDGWRQGSRLLTFERGAGAGGGSATPGMRVGRSVEALMKHYPDLDDPHLRHRLVEAYCRERVIEWTRMRIDAQRRAGRAAGQEASILKLYNSHHAQALQNLAFDLEGINAAACVDGDRWADSTRYSFLRIRSATIAGGSSEMQRNILGERVLGLPREPAVDRDIPWNQTLRS
jgi:alkylation response protein AidB-like acyl-CoA dehydrogenase